MNILFLLGAKELIQQTANRVDPDQVSPPGAYLIWVFSIRFTSIHVYGGKGLYVSMVIQ